MGAESQLQLTLEEVEYLRGLLQDVLKQTRVEEHRTRAPGYRETVIRQEALIEALLAKLGGSV